jgi:hypothetical protein
MFDREGVDGPWLADISGTITSTATGESIRLPLPPGSRQGPETAGWALGLQHKPLAPGSRHGPDTVRVSLDGHRVFAATLHPKWACVLDLQTGQIQNRPVRQQHWMPDMLDPTPTLPNWNLYRVIDLIRDFASTQLAFCGRKGVWRSISFTGQSICIRKENPGLWHNLLPFSFSPFSIPAGLGCTLQVAEWPNGSKAFLDSRGLLHLKSHDPSLAEVSLVLSDREVAGWTSDGYVCGPSFFFDDQRPSNPRKVFHRIEDFLSRAATPVSSQ